MPVGDGALPYMPIVEALRTLVAEVGVGEVRQLGPSWPELARLLPALGEAGGTGPPDQAAQSACSGCCSGCWAFLVRDLRRERMLLVVTCRDRAPASE